MRGYLVRRLLLIVPTLAGITFLAFGLASLAPGDPAVEFLRRTVDQQPTPEDVERARHELGLDRPFLVRYVSWCAGAVRGDLGISYATRRPVRDELARRVPHTLELTVPAALLALLVAVPAGVLSAVTRNRWPDVLVRLAALAGASLPGFWLGLILITVFAVRLSLVPVAGRSGASSVILPVVALAAPVAAVLARFTRSAVLDALGEEHVVTARSKGLRERSVVVRHALRNALVPLVTAFGTSVGHLLAGAVVIETIFVWPGVGKLAYDAITARDHPVIEALVLYTGVVFVALNLLVDLVYPVVDRRIALGDGEVP